MNDSLAEFKDQLAQSERLHAETAGRFRQAEKERDKQLNRLNEFKEADENILREIDLKMQQFDLLTEKFREEQSHRHRHEENLKKSLQIEQQITDHQNRLSQLQKRCSKVSRRSCSFDLLSSFSLLQCRIVPQPIELIDRWRKFNWKSTPLKPF